MRSATFRNIALGILALAAAYHLGARSAGAQAPGNPLVGVAASSGCLYAGAANGDVYVYGCGGPISWRLLGNVFGGGPIPVDQETWGALKARYRGAPGAAQPDNGR